MPVSIQRFFPGPVGIVRWQARVATGPQAPPEPRLTVVVKATFSLAADGEAPLREPQEPLSTDRPGMAPDELVYPSDFVPFKPLSDVLLAGHARAATPTRAIGARLVVNGSTKIFHALSATEGTAVPLSSTYLRAGPSPADAPVRVGALAPWSAARAALADPRGFEPGGPPTAPLPVHFDYRFFNAAPADQQRPAPLTAVELGLVGLLQGAPKRWVRLPRTAPRVFLLGRGDRAEVPREIEVRADTLWIDTDRALCTLVWRGWVAVEESAAVSLVTAADRGGAAATWASVADRVEDADHAPPPTERAGAPAAAEEAKTVPRFVLGGMGGGRLGFGSVEHDVAQNAPLGAAALKARGEAALRRAQEMLAPAAPAARPAGDLDATLLPELQAHGIQKPALPFHAAAPMTATVPLPSSHGATAPPSGRPETEHTSTRAFVQGPAKATLPFPGAKRPPPRGKKDTLPPPVAAAPARTLPFQDAGGPRAFPPPPPSAPPIPLGYGPVPAPPPASVPPISLGYGPVPSSQPSSAPPISLGHGGAAPSPSTPAPPSVERPPIAIEVYAAVKAALWEGAEALDEALAPHGLREEEWRMAERGMQRALTAEAAVGRADVALALGDALSAARSRLAAASEETRTLEEYARLKASVEAAEDPAPVLAAAGLRAGAFQRLERRWRMQAESDPAIAEEMRARLAAARAAPAAWH